MSFTRSSRLRAVAPDTVWVFNYDENGSKVGGRRVTVAARCNLSTGMVTYGASVFRRETTGEPWVRKHHRRTAEGRLKKCPQTYQIVFSEDAFSKIREEFQAKTATEVYRERIHQNYLNYRHRKKTAAFDEKEILHRVYESMIRDYVTDEMKRQTRAAMFTKGTTSKGTKASRGARRAE